MSSYDTENIRNIALVGHALAGKTTLTEALLHGAGAINTPGSVEKGSTVTDFEPEEKEYQHSLNAAVVSLDHSGTHVNLIDTPGFPDFMGQALSALPAVETMALVINAQAGIEMVTQRMMERATERDLCRMIVINKIDAHDIDLPALLSRIQESFGKECLPINLPSGSGESVVDCFFNPGGGSADFSSIEEAHTRIVDQVVEVDEDLMTVYLDQGEVSPDQLHDPFEKALREGHLIPVCFISARTGAGVKELLEIFAKLMPNPKEGNPPPFIKGEGADAEPVAAEPDPSRHVLAHVFKVAVDPFVGKLGVFRIHQGTVTKDTQLYINDSRKPFKVGHLFKLQGKEHTETDLGVPGDICAVAKVEDIRFDAVLHDSHDEDQYHLRPMDLPKPMVGLAIEPTKRGDEQKISSALQKLAAGDPTLVIEHNAAMNETVIRGLGDLHLRVILEKMKDRYNAEVKTRPPKIPYRETISANAEGHHRHKKQTGGAGQFGEVFLRVEPLPRGSGFEFVDKVVGGVIPNQFIPAVEKGVRQVMESGAIVGYPMQDIRVTVCDGKHHSVDSKEVAFVAAGKKAFLDAIQKAKPLALEPIVNIEVIAPDANMGDITGDLSGKRGRINNTETLPGNMVSITGTVPLSELNNYQSKLKSVTGGQGSYAIEFSHYEPVPPNVQQQLVAEYKPGKEE
ncbi:MAG: elongation factor G [Acidiferrobacterales bacterium]